MKTMYRFLWVLGTTFLLFSCSGKVHDPDSIARRVKVAAVVQSESSVVKSFPGIIKEIREINLAFRVAGPITRIAVKEGDYVKAGQLIAQIDPRDYEIQLQVAQAQYDQVKAETGRVVELYNRKSVASNDYDKAVAGESLVTAQLKHARHQLEDTRLLAPVSGYIQKVNFKTNELIDAGMPVASLIDVSRYQVEIEIPVSMYTRRDDILSFSGIQASVGTGLFPLKLLSYSRKASQNQLYKVLLALDPVSQPNLASGMDVQVNITLNDAVEPQVCIPLVSLFNQDGKTYVWVYKSDEQSVTRREVNLGELIEGGKINIKQGLEVGEIIVVAGVNMLKEGQKVEALEGFSETNVGGML